MTCTDDPSLDHGQIADAVRMALEAGLESPFMLYAHPETLPFGWTQGGMYTVYVDGHPQDVAVSEDLSRVVTPALGEAR